MCSRTAYLTMTMNYSTYTVRLLLARKYIELIKFEKKIAGHILSERVVLEIMNFVENPFAHLKFFQLMVVDSLILVLHRLNVVIIFQHISTHKVSSKNSRKYHVYNDQLNVFIIWASYTYIEAHKYIRPRKPQIF